MHEHLGKEAGQEEPIEADCELEAGPVVSVFHDFERVTIEVDVAIEVHLVKGLHWDLASSAVLQCVVLIAEVEVVLHRATWVFCFLVLAR